MTRAAHCPKTRRRAAPQLENAPAGVTNRARAHRRPPKASPLKSDASSRRFPIIGHQSCYFESHAKASVIELTIRGNRRPHYDDQNYFAIYARLQRRISDILRFIASSKMNNRRNRWRSGDSPPAQSASMNAAHGGVDYHAA